MTAPEQPTPEAREAAKRAVVAIPAHLFDRMSTGEIAAHLALDFDRFAAQRVAEAVELEQHRLEAERQKILGDPRVGVHIPPADWGLPQNAATPPPGDAGERARKLIGSLVINHGMGCVASMLEGAEREAEAFLQSERTAAASQARREALLECADIVKPSRPFEELVAQEAENNPAFAEHIDHADDFIRMALTGILRREFRLVEAAIRTLATPQESAS